MDSYSHLSSAIETQPSEVVTPSSTDPRTLHHQAIAGRVNEQAQAIAQATLASTNGRATYDWENDVISLKYMGDIEVDGKPAYGATLRRHFVTTGPGPRWAKDSPLRSESGTGLINLGWQHFEGCADEVVLAKLDIWHALLTPELGLVEFVVRNFASKQKLAGHLRERLTLRLDEVLEQLVLSNPATQDLSDTKRSAGGLDLVEVADGSPVVGWAVKVLEASIANTLRRISKNEPVLSSWDEVPEDSDGIRAGGLTQMALGAENYGVGADEQYESDLVADANDRYLDEVGRKRGHERVVFDADTLHRATDLPFLKVPTTAVRKSLIAAMAEDDSLPARSVKAYYDLLTGGPTPEQLNVSDDWLNIWAKYDADDAYRLLAMSKAHKKAPALLVEAAIGFYEQLTSTTNGQLTRMLGRISRDRNWRELSAAVVTAWDRKRNMGDERGWTKAAAEVVASPMSPYAEVSDVEAALLDALHRGR